MYIIKDSDWVVTITPLPTFTIPNWVNYEYTEKDATTMEMELV